MEGDYTKFVEGIETGDPDKFKSTPLGPDRNSSDDPIWISRKAIDKNV